MKTLKKDFWNLDWLKFESVKVIWQLLSSQGAQVYFVGGCVRDTIQGREIKDIDIATDALPSQVLKITQAAGLKALKTGYDHGSISVIINEERFEVTTFRSDLVTDGRHSKVAFSSNILDDARRRDFTMNAIYMNIEGDIFDPISGLNDLLNGYVRFIGHPEKRIHEDYLRVFRYFRFLSIYGEKQDSIDYAAVKACSDAIPFLKMLSHDRVWVETQKILLVDDPSIVLKIMHSCGVLDQILPDAKIERLQRLLKMESQFEFEFKEINRLAALNVMKVSSWVKNFPLKKEQRRWLDKLLVNLKDSSSLRVKGYKYKMNLAIAALAVFKSDSVVRLRDEDLIDIKHGALQQFPLGASDLLEFLPPSKKLGDELRRLKDIWFGSELEYDRDDLLRDLEKNLSV